MSSTPSVLLTGGAGYIGGHVALALRERGWRVTAADDLSVGNRAAILPETAFYEGDIGDDNFLRALFAAEKFDAVAHLAAVASVPESVADPARCDLVNRVGSEKIIKMAQEHGVRHFVFSSTSAVYDESGEPPFAEDAPLRPISPYAASKLAAEKCLAASGLSHAILRYFNVGGVDAKMRAGNYKKSDTTLIKSALECASGRRPCLHIYGTDYPTPDGTGVRDYIHVSDIAAAHALALDYLRDGGKSDIFNLGLGRGFSVREVAAAAKEVSGVNFAVKDMPRREGDPATVFSNPQKARQLLGFTPASPDLKTIIADSWAWECRKNNDKS